VTSLRNVTAAAYSERDMDSLTVEDDSQGRFRLYRLCPCETCEATGKGEIEIVVGLQPFRRGTCDNCRGEGKVRQLVATCEDEASVGVALVTLGREGEWEDCPFGLLDKQGEKGKKWLVSPWLPSPRNVSDAARTLASSKKGER
jgi:hypothetical protein